MAAPADLVDIVRDLPTTAFAGEAFRHLSPGTSPLSGHGAWVNGGRWNPPLSFPVLYLALSEEVARAEFRRMARKLGEPIGTFLPRELHRYEVSLVDVVDLRDADARRAVAPNDRRLTADPPTLCQAIGFAAHETGREGLLVASATGAGLVLPVFYGRLGSTSYVRPTTFATWS